jgi:hypothetical protein
MKITDTIRDLQARQIYTSAFKEVNKQPLDIVEQAAIDRRQFLFVSKMGPLSVQAYKESSPSQLSYLETTGILQRFVPTLSSEFHWLAQADIQHVTDLFNTIVHFRRQFIQQHGTIPSGSRIYREYRSMLELAQNDERAHFNVVTLEALLNGNIKSGVLPSFSIE